MIKLHFKFRPYPAMPNRECMQFAVNLNDRTHAQLVNAIKDDPQYAFAIDAGPNAELQVWPGREVTLACSRFKLRSEPLSTRQFLRVIANAPEVHTHA